MDAFIKRDAFKSRTQYGGFLFRAMTFHSLRAQCRLHFATQSIRLLRDRSRNYKGLRKVLALLLHKNAHIVSVRLRLNFIYIF